MTTTPPFTAPATACLAVSGNAAEAPSRIMLLPRGGRIDCRDGRSFSFDLARLAARFSADGIKIPLDVNHATEILAPQGQRADPVGWITAVEVDGGALYGTVDWIDPAAAPALLRAYPYVSPTFPASAQKEARWLKSVALVATPALGNQPALASAQSDTADPDPEEPRMKTVIAALGLAETATEAECLAAVTRLTGAVPKQVHDEAVARLAAVSAELATIKGAARAAEVDKVIEGALAARKILPAQRDHYVSLCATDEGLAAVTALLAAAPVLLGASGLDSKPVPDGAATRLSAEDRVVMAQLGLTEAEFLAANPAT